jgi:hypothetical protein
MQVTTSKYDNFVNSINSEQTKEQYLYSLAQFLKKLSNRFGFISQIITTRNI